MGPGENAGVVDVGGGLALAFKVESHNHPSAVEPFEGAATGVGGILRDVFAVGARPIAVLDSLRFGEPETSERSRYLLDRAVAGIGHYGNSIGVPTVGGEIYFEPSYEQNCLVNAMCLGLAPHERLIRSAAAGPGNVVVLLGALTGRDGIGGASVLASAELGEGDEAKRPSVQIGDPFAEKKLLECCLELLDRELLVSLQDLGAAGLTSSASEMASKGGVGLDARRVASAAARARHGAVRDHGLRVPGADAVRRRARAGRRGDRRVRALGDARDADRGGHGLGSHPHPRPRRRPVADMPVSILVDDCPLYDLEPAPPEGPLYAPRRRRARRGREPGADAAGAAGSPNIASRRPVFEQYDSIVQSRTVRRPERGRRRRARAAGRHRRSRSRSTATAGGSPCDPRRGAAEAVYECAANLACVGAEPLGLTNCLNFGNPEKPHVAWQLTEAVEGLAEACEALGVPVVGGNVSLYNEAPDRPDLPDAGRRDRRHAARRARAGRLGFAARAT